jgi:CRISPR system Cascade subunit CasC
MLVEAGDRQPRSLAEAFRTPVAADTAAAVDRLAGHLADLDAAYATGESRRFLSIVDREGPSAERGSIADLAAFARGLTARIVEAAA